jgi:nitrile hydratase
MHPRHDHDHAHDVAQHDPEAAERNRVPFYGQRIYAMRDLLVERGILDPADVQAEIEYVDARSPANGARLVARACVWSSASTRRA